MVEIALDTLINILIHKEILTEEEATVVTTVSELLSMFLKKGIISEADVNAHREEVAGVIRRALQCIASEVPIDSILVMPPDK